MKIQSINFNFFRFRVPQKKYFQKPFLNQDFDTFTFTGNFRKYTPDEIDEQKARLKAFLEDTIQNKKTITGNLLSKQTGIPASTIQYRFSSDEELMSLWQKAKKYDQFKYTQEEKSEFENAIIKELEKAIQASTKVVISELATKTGVSTTTVKRIIQESEYGRSLYEQAMKNTYARRSADEISETEKKIGELLTKALKEGKTKTDVEFGKELGISASTFKKQVNNNENLRQLYKKIQNPARRGTLEGGFEGKSELVRSILEQYKSQNKKIKWKELIEKSDISHRTLERILNGNPDIKLLWESVRSESHTKYSRQDIAKLDDYIQWYLESKINKGETTTLAEIAQCLEISSAIAAKRLSKNPRLKFRWDKVKSVNQHYYGIADKNLQIAIMTDMLKDANKQGKKLSAQQVCAKAKISVQVFYRRMEQNKQLKKLWKENKALN